MEFIILKESSKEWGEIWDWLRVHPINEGLEEPCTALNKEREWVYIGTFKNGDELISQFQHDSHPRTNEPTLRTYPHKLYSTDSILKSKRIK